MFGLVTASLSELSDEEKDRYSSVYCGICRAIGREQGQLCRLALSYDMAFLSLLLMSLYEPEEMVGKGRCVAHPAKKRSWTDNEYVRYGADMNVALAYYKACDDWQDDKKPSAKLLEKVFGARIEAIQEKYPRQCGAMEQCIGKLSRLERENCPNPDETANAFGALMAELMVYREDLWAEKLRQMGHYLGRYIYLADACMDYSRDLKKQKYNPFIAMGAEPDRENWKTHLVLAMGGCTDAYERLPLVQDKGILDNILYSGVWMNYHRGEKDRRERKDG